MSNWFKLFPTWVGGGAFGNDPDWITDAIMKSLHQFRPYGLEVIFNSYSQPNPHVQKMMEQLG
jgi:hypothetical protein